MRRFALVLFVSFLVPLISGAQKPDRPKLVIGIVVDQMRWDYLYRYADRYGKDGFNRMVKQGYSCENTFIPYTPTYTAAGHTSVYTGSVPAINGIIGNSWYRRDLKRGWYCTEDTSVTTVGSTSTAGKMSPRNMWTSTITDELRLATNFESKTIGIALKDRGAILPAGHAANAAYWFDNASGGWITSTYYMKELPEWVRKLNDQKLPDQYLSKNWNTLYPISTYKQSTEDVKDYEASILGEDNSFPHNTATLTTNKYEAFRQTPGGNTYTFDMARATIDAEKMGQRGATDFLTVSFSSTDYVGHAFGPNSIEAEDTYLRFDRELGEFFKYLDTKIGAGQYLVFLTADHGVAHVPGFLEEHNMPGGTADDAVIQKWINTSAQKKYGIAKAIETVGNYQLYLNYAALDSAKIPVADFKLWALGELKSHPAIMSAYDLTSLAAATVNAKIRERITNGFNYKLSGDIQFIFMPGFFDGSNKGTTHGTWNPYDAHIPLVWYGWKIKPGKTNRETYMTDIAATVAALLRIQMPNGCVGNVIEEITR
ncbi:MAG: alkaline phosphatase family protein [Chitinophagaceae bacterium]|nr:MAG: alkaline phosphatase family protein [Chitinophagaceae bacterium]